MTRDASRETGLSWGYDISPCQSGHPLWVRSFVVRRKPPILGSVGKKWGTRLSPLLFDTPKEG